MPTAIASGKYRKMPALKTTDGHNTSPADRQGKCARLTGHILRVEDNSNCLTRMRGGKIVCQSCGAEWRDEGY